MSEMYDNEKHVEDTFTQSNLSEYLIQAQWAEFIELKKAISEIYNRKESSLRVLDVGIGDARVLKHLVAIEEIWSMINSYDGIDVAQNCIDISNEVISKLKVDDKASATLLDATKLKKLNKEYDLIIFTWFTVGNFYPTHFDFNNFVHGQDMSKNDKIESIFKQAYEMLSEDGEIIIGSMYLDNTKTRIKQEDSYKAFGWEVITDQRDCFTATKDGWWSLRFTKKRVYDYLYFIPKNKFVFTPLDTYDYAMMARIRK